MKDAAVPDQNLSHWQPRRNVTAPPVPPGGPVTKVPLALWRGLRGRCPGCGQAPIFRGFLTVAAACPICATPLDQVSADDAPPYFTILLVGHIVIPAMLVFDAALTPRMWIEACIWIPITILLSVGLLRPIKGATVALMLELNMLRPIEDAA